MRRALAAAVAALALAPAAAHADGYRLAVSLAKAGPRPAASRKRAQRRSCGCARVRAQRPELAADRFRVPGRGRSRNVIGIHDTPAVCLVILMAHSDSTPGSPGAVDNASGLGALADFAPRVLRPRPARATSGWWPPAPRSGSTRAGPTTWAPPRSCGA